MRTVQNNSRAYGKHETTYHRQETVNGKRQTKRKHGHVVTSAVCRKRDAKSLYCLFSLVTTENCVFYGKFKVLQLLLKLIQLTTIVRTFLNFRGL